MAVTPTSLGTTKVAGSTGEVADTNIRNLAINQLTNATTGAVTKGELVFNVEDYGATGNGTTNDTTAVQNALAAAIAAKGELYLPGGTYLMTTSLTVSADNVTIRGAGKDATILLYTGSTAAITSGAGSTLYQRWRFSDFTVDTRQASINTVGLDLDNVGRSEYRNLRLRCTVSAGGGIAVLFTGGEDAGDKSTYYNQFFNCEFSATGVCLTSTGYANAQFFYGCICEGTGVGLKVEGGTATHNVSNWFFDTCSFSVTNADSIILGKASGGLSSVAYFTFVNGRFEPGMASNLSMLTNAVNATFLGGTRSGDVTTVNNGTNNHLMFANGTTWEIGAPTLKVGGVTVNEAATAGVAGTFIGHPIATADAVLTASRVYWWKVMVNRSFTFDQAVIRVAVSSGNIDVGIYGTSAGTVGTKIVSSGSVACPAVGKGVISLSSTTITPGLYWLAMAADNATASFGSNARQSEWLDLRVKSSTFPLPSNGTGQVANVSAMPVMTLEKS